MYVKLFGSSVNLNFRSPIKLEMTVVALDALAASSPKTKTPPLGWGK